VKPLRQGMQTKDTLVIPRPPSWSKRPEATNHQKEQNCE
jgi:hypothetical protein